MTVPYTFATKVGSIPLSQLDSNFATVTTLGTTPFLLGDTVPTIAGLNFSSPVIVGNMLPSVTNTQTLGSASYVWNNVYSTTFTGNLIGNVTGSFAGSITATSGTIDTTVIGGTTPAAISGTTGTFTGNIQSISQNGGQLAGLRDRIINSSMLLAQRATSATVTAGTTVPTAIAGYPCVDRFFVYSTGGNVTAAQVNGTVATSKRLQISGGASVATVGVGQRIEASNCFDMAGKTVTLSVELANTALTSVTWTASYANTTDAFGTIGTATKSTTAAANTGSFTINATPTIYSVSFTVPAAAITGIEILFTVGAQTSGTWTIGEVQFEVGSVATPLEYRLGTLERAFCQRYYYKIISGTTTGVLGGAFTQSTTSYKTWGFFPVTMRALPSALETDGTFGNYSMLNGATSTPNTVLPAINTRTNQYMYFLDNTTGATLPATAGISGVAIATSLATTYLAWSVEIP